MKRAHMATYPIFSKLTGKRVGTGYAHSKQECLKHIGDTGFRFRNKECETEFINWDKDIPS